MTTAAFTTTARCFWVALPLFVSLSCSERFNDKPLPSTFQLNAVDSAAPDSQLDSSENAQPDSSPDCPFDSLGADTQESSVDAESSAADLGESCSSNVDCKSGVCTDGVCCQTLCNGCHSCALPGFLGICKPVDDGLDPHGACFGDVIACKGVCDGHGACRWPSASLPCGQASCDSLALQVVQPTCDKIGDCSDRLIPCGAYRCDPSSSACFAECQTAAGHCASDATCGSGVCVAHRTNGWSCSRPEDCINNFCVDGVCCDNACSGTCKACNVAGHVGTCTAIEAGKDPDNECPGLTSPCGGVCDGAGACSFAVAGVKCASNSCTTQPSQFHVFVCDGSGECGEGLKNCGPYACDAQSTGCLSKCTSELECSLGYRCKAGQCTTN